MPREYFNEGVDPDVERSVRTAIAVLGDLGATTEEISLPNTDYGIAVYYILAPAEASSNLARYDGVKYGLRVPGRDLIEMSGRTRAAGFGTEVKRRIMLGTYALSAGYYDAYYGRAQKVRTLVRRDFEAAFASGRSDRGPHDPERRLQARREAGPALDVPQRRLHGPREPGRPPGRVDSLRLQPGRTAHRPAAHRPPAGRSAVSSAPPTPTNRPRPGSSGDRT